MNIVTKITLSEHPGRYANANEGVTTNPDGTVLSRVFDLKWDFSGQEQGSMLRTPIVRFRHVDDAYRRDIQATLAVIMEKYKALNTKPATSSQVVNWRSGLVAVRNILGHEDWASLSDDRVYKKFKRKLKEQIETSNLGEGFVGAILTVINKLNELDLCARKPNGIELRAMVKKEAQQHIAIPIGMYQPMIARALEVVETYHPYRHTINDAQAQLEKIHQEESVRKDVSQTKKAIWSRVSKRASALKFNVPNFKLTRNGTELNRIQTACAIVVLAFSGMRVGELTSTNKFSYEEKGGNQIPTLKGEETKRNGRVINETWQTHKVAKDALELAYDINQFLRDIYSEKNNEDLERGDISSEVHARYARQITSAFLVVMRNEQSTTYCQPNHQRLFSVFSESSGIVATQADVDEFNRLNPSREGQLKVGGTLPKLTPHDFRRSFAVFFKRYGFGSSATIKFQYKHRNIQMSDYYSNNARLQAMEDILLDNDLLSLMNEEGIRFGVDIFDEIYNESEHLAGAGGERIAQDKFERLSNGEHVYMTRSEIDRLVRNGTLSAVKLPTGGYCTNATCSRVCGIGEFAAEIKPCEHQVVTDKQAKVILRQNKRIIKAFRDINTGDPMMNSILIGQKQKIQRNERLIKDFNLNFEPFNDKIKGIIETVEA